MSDPIKPTSKPSQPPEAVSAKVVPQDETNYSALNAIQTDAQLREAFEKFSKNSARLEGAYNTLLAQFQQVSAQLHEVYCQLEVKIKELEAAHSYLHNLLGQMSQGVLFVSTDGVILTCNRAMSGWIEAQGELRGKTFAECFADQYFGFSMTEALQTKQGPQLSYAESTRDKHPSQLEVTTNFVTYASEQASQESGPLQEGLLVMARDISEVRSLERAAAQHDRLRDLGQVAENLAERVGVFLSGIESAAHAQAESQSEKEENRKILENCASIAQLLQKVPAYSKPLEAHLEALDLIPLLNEVVDFVHGEKLLKAHQTLRCQTSESIIAVVDRQLLKTSLVNLIANAAHASRENGEVTLKLEKVDRVAQIEVIDHGTGISEENLSKIFSPLFSTKSNAEGLGLSEVRKQLLAMHAQIDVKSIVGTGSTFAVKIPLEDQEPTTSIT